jgi:histidinol-phosphatase
LSDDLRFAERLADAADEITRRYVGAQVPGARTKPDGSPVTQVDLEVERALLTLVELERPDAGFLGEEVGFARHGDPRWIVDGIDGTAAFVAGRAEWSTLIELEDRGNLTVGLVSAPALGQRWSATSGNGAWEDGGSGKGRQAHRRLAASGQSSLMEASIGVWPPAEALAGRHRDAAIRLAAAPRQ